MKAIIVGGGIGGLSAALSFAHFGWDVEVLEQADEFSEVGAGIQISPNGVKVLRALGVADAVESKSVLPHQGQFRNGRTGQLIASFKMGANMERRYGAPYWQVHRADLISALMEAVENNERCTIRTGSRVRGYGQDQTCAYALLRNGDRALGDVLVGADGIKSVIGTQMLGPSKPRFTGNVAWRAVVPVDQLGDNAPLPNATVWFGEGKHAVTYLLRKGTLANLVGVVEREGWTKESWMQQGSPAEAQRDFAGWHPTIEAILGKAEAHYRWALFDRAPLNQWCDRRVALLGDACHPMLPFMAQGAVMAIEDGFVLARELAQCSNLADAMRGYFRLRHARTARVQAAARANMGIFHRRSALAKAATYGPLWLVSRTLPKALDWRNDWLYSHDVTGGT